MTFNIEQAKRIKAHYEYLIGEPMSVANTATEMPITDILIAPSEPKQQQIFVSEFNQLRDNNAALLKSGFDKNELMIFFVHHDTWAGNVWTSEIDKFLTRMNIEKVYTNPDF
jgi:hypothetical protein